MTQFLTVDSENTSMQMHRELGPFEHLIWLVDQWAPRHFILVARA